MAVVEVTGVGLAVGEFAGSCGGADVDGLAISPLSRGWGNLDCVLSGGRSKCDRAGDLARGCPPSPSIVVALKWGPAVTGILDSVDGASSLSVSSELLLTDASPATRSAIGAVATSPGVEGVSDTHWPGSRGRRAFPSKTSGGGRWTGAGSWPPDSRACGAGAAMSSAVEDEAGVGRADKAADDEIAATGAVAAAGSTSVSGFGSGPGSWAGP